MLHFKIPDNILLQEVQGEMVLLNVNNGEYFKLNRVGAFIVNELNQGKSYSEVFDTLKAQFAIEENTLKSDLDDLVQNLQEHYLLQPEPSHP